MAKRWNNTLTSADVTPEEHYLNRRQIIAGLAGIGLAVVLRFRPWQQVI